MADLPYHVDVCIPFDEPDDLRCLKEMRAWCDDRRAISAIEGYGNLMAIPGDWQRVGVGLMFVGRYSFGDRAQAITFKLAWGQ